MMTVPSTERMSELAKALLADSIDHGDFLHPGFPPDFHVFVTMVWMEKHPAAARFLSPPIGMTVNLLAEVLLRSITPGSVDVGPWVDLPAIVRFVVEHYDDFAAQKAAGLAVEAGQERQDLMDLLRQVIAEDGE